MSHKDQDKQQEMIDQLKKMPDIHDARNKEEVYKRVSSQLNLVHKKTNNKKKLVPVFTTVAAALILILLVPVLLNTEMQQSSEDNSSMDQADMLTKEESENAGIQDHQARDEQEISEEKDQADQETNVMQTEYEHFVIHDTDQNDNIYFSGISDVQGQYIIPVAFIISGEKDLQYFYNNMDEYVSELENNNGEYLFENVTFHIDQSNNEIALELSNDFSLEGGSAMENMLENMLATMFRPYGTEKVTIQTEDGEPAELGQFGQIDELPLRQIAPSSYKLYEMDNTKMLIRIPNDEQTGIEEAMMKMKEDEPEYHVFKTIPDHIQFTTEQKNNQLHFIFSDDTELIADQRDLEMIEAILMTAKSYGYEQVSFENTEYEYIGPYNLMEPVPVPEAVNPIYPDEE